MFCLRRPAFVLAFLLTMSFPSVGRADRVESPQVVWRLLDYLAVDYAGAVRDGQILSTSEYAEMTEFAGQVSTRITALPSTRQRNALERDALALQQAVTGKVSPEVVSKMARELGSALLAAYPVPLAPSKAPNLKRGAVLYSEQCSACHGETGAGNGPSADGLTPPPINFTDMNRARQRSIFGLYQVIEQGIDGTAMAGFAHLPANERWALAFYVGQIAFSEAEAKAGEQLWKSDTNLHEVVPNLHVLSQTTSAELADKIGDEPAKALTAFLRRHPEAVVPSGGIATLAIARKYLTQSLTQYETGDHKGAADSALAAYLDGIEPIEPVLQAREEALKQRIEIAMGELRASIRKGLPSTEIRSQSDHISALFDAAEAALVPENASNSASFFGAFTILLREGLEALLIVVAMVAFLRKAQRRDVLPHVHAGWIAALVAGGLTWASATYVISVSGASRELTEGFGSLLAAIVLISVGVWMHGKAQGDAWQEYIRTKLSKALSGRSAWFLFFLSFVVVYREVFETILFLAALWSPGTQVALIVGLGAGVAVLACIAWTLLRYSRQMPMTKFFSLSSILMAVLAIVLTGKGVAGLQEAGLLDIHPLHNFPRIEIFGLYPTIDGVVGQLLALAVLVIGFWYNGRSQIHEAV